jgi:signal transduction histidine kinase
MGQMSIPLRAGEQMLGMLHIVRAESFTENDRLVLESLAGVLSSVLLNARRYQQLQERIEAQNLAEKKMVESARLAAIGEIAAGVAHELNNPLTTIAGFTELVLDDLPVDARPREDLALVLQEARRARDVVRRLLDFSRQDESLRIPADINEILGEALALVHHLARVNGVEIQYVPWDALPLIRMDRGPIKQVILNLVQNALHAMPRGGTLVLQTTLEQRDARDWVALRVLDTGEGIPVELISRVFEPFFTTKPPGQGTGLGLSVSNHIVMDHGGFMEVESQPGQGTCFTVWLPVGS